MIATIIALARLPRKMNRIADDQDHADDQVVQHVMGRDVDEVGPLVEDADASSPWAGSRRSGSP